jgi:hypothetical protein
VELPIKKTGESILLVGQDAPGDLLTPLAPVESPVVLDLEPVGMPAIVQAEEGVDQEIDLGPYHPEG